MKLDRDTARYAVVVATSPIVQGVGFELAPGRIPSSGGSGQGP